MYAKTEQDNNVGVLQCEVPGVSCYVRFSPATTETACTKLFACSIANERRLEYICNCAPFPVHGHNKKVTVCHPDINQQARMVHFFGIEWAPLRVPFHRRLQVNWWSFLLSQLAWSESENIGPKQISNHLGNKFVIHQSNGCNICCLLQIQILPASCILFCYFFSRRWVFCSTSCPFWPWALAVCFSCCTCCSRTTITCPWFTLSGTYWTGVFPWKAGAQWRVCAVGGFGPGIVITSPSNLSKQRILTQAKTTCWLCTRTAFCAWVRSATSPPTQRISEACSQAWGPYCWCWLDTFSFRSTESTSCKQVLP